MSLQWGLVAGFLYIEIIVLLILLLPGISPQRWLKIFRSRILHSLGTQTQLYFYGLFGLLCLLFLDAIREMRKYSSEEYDLNVNPKAEVQAHMKLFRAQRNFYISGFALLLTLVIRRISTLLSTQGTLMAQNEASMKQASSATAAARKFMAEAGNDNSSRDEIDRLQVELSTLKDELVSSNAEATNAKTDRDAMKSQSKSLTDEYDRLLKEHEKLQRKVAQGQGGVGDKKGD